MKYTYLYQNKNNENCSGEIQARNRADAYTILRKSGIRPYRVIGDDPVDWRPIAFWVAIATALFFMLVSAVLFIADGKSGDKRLITLTPEEAEAFRARAKDAVYNAPPTYRYNVWRGVNARLKERGLQPLPKPYGMVEEDAFPTSTWR